jgi:hypothetical protein
MPHKDAGLRKGCGALARRRASAQIDHRLRRSAAPALRRKLTRLALLRRSAQGRRIVRVESRQPAQQSPPVLPLLGPHVDRDHRISGDISRRLLRRPSSACVRCRSQLRGSSSRASPNSLILRANRAPSGSRASSSPSQRFSCMSWVSGTPISREMPQRRKNLASRRADSIPRFGPRSTSYIRTPAEKLRPKRKHLTRAASSGDAAEIFHGRSRCFQGSPQPEGL